ncbi:hypothetical protein P7K49_031581 [Saguinus oedipus]|uniref:Uncharacterized protein n=1 Tax=Saguinus oedipus TaxID=9490 RepID=A0ABQ9U0Q8_SAGOE|nr:hypothetical protein P7K49_031581 [Saguinus oedipus]
MAEPRAGRRQGRDTLNQSTSPHQRPIHRWSFTVAARQVLPESPLPPPSPAQPRPVLRPRPAVPPQRPAAGSRPSPACFQFRCPGLPASPS